MIAINAPSAAPSRVASPSISETAIPTSIAYTSGAAGRYDRRCASETTDIERDADGRRFTFGSRITGRKGGMGGAAAVFECAERAVEAVDLCSRLGAGRQHGNRGTVEARDFERVDCGFPARRDFENTPTASRARSLSTAFVVSSLMDVSLMFAGCVGQGWRAHAAQPLLEIFPDAGGLDTEANGHPLWSGSAKFPFELIQR